MLANQNSTQAESSTSESDGATCAHSAHDDIAYKPDTYLPNFVHRDRPET